VECRKYMLNYLYVDYSIVTVILATDYIYKKY
jgi:hypothetical protein